MKKKLLSILLVVVMIVTFWGCGSKDPDALRIQIQQIPQITVEKLQ